MNERIKELAEQADISLSERDGWWVAYDEDLERFAELVRQDEREREWVELTDEEIAQVVGSPIDEVYLVDFCRVIAKIKEKNNG